MRDIEKGREREREIEKERKKELQTEIENTKWPSQKLFSFDLW